MSVIIKGVSKRCLPIEVLHLSVILLSLYRYIKKGLSIGNNLSIVLASFITMLKSWSSNLIWIDCFINIHRAFEFMSRIHWWLDHSLFGSNSLLSLFFSFNLLRYQSLYFLTAIISLRWAVGIIHALKFFLIDIDSDLSLSLSYYSVISLHFLINLLNLSKSKVRVSYLFKSDARLRIPWFEGASFFTAQRANTSHSSLFSRLSTILATGSYIHSTLYPFFKTSCRDTVLLELHHVLLLVVFKN